MTPAIAATAAAADKPPAIVNSIVSSPPTTKHPTATATRYAGATAAGNTMKPTAAMAAHTISSAVMAGPCHGAVQTPEIIRSGGHNESSRLEPAMPNNRVPNHTANAVTGTRAHRTAVTPHIVRASALLTLKIGSPDTFARR